MNGRHERLVWTTILCGTTSTYGFVFPFFFSRCLRCGANAFLKKIYVRYNTYPDVPGVGYPDGFQGNSIPVDGLAVARLIEEHVDRKSKQR